MLDNAQIIALLKLLIQLRAENLAMRKVLVRPGQTGDSELNSMIAEERQKVEKLPVIAHALLRNDLVELTRLLGTLSTAHPA